MGWLARKTSIGTLKSDIKQASGLPLDQRLKLASEMEEFIEEIRSVMQTPDHPSELMRLFQLHGANRKLQVPGGFSALWAHHAFRESYLLALIKAPNDPKWFKGVHTLLHGIRGPLGLVGIEPQGVKAPTKDVAKSSDDVGDKTTTAADLQDRLFDHLSSGKGYESFTLGKGDKAQTLGSLLHGSEDAALRFRAEHEESESESEDAAEELDGALPYSDEKLAYAIEDAAEELDGAWEYYYPNGQLRAKGTSKDGEWNGPWEHYYPNGQLRAKGTGKDGEWDGPWEEYYENGQLKEIFTYKDGNWDGPWEKYYENGQLKGKGTWTDCLENGPHEQYYENGDLKEMGTYNLGEKCGEWIDEEGDKVTYPPCPTEIP